MKLFQSIKKTAAILGIRPDYSFSGRILVACLHYGLCTILLCLFLFFNAQSYEEYTNSIYNISVSISTATCYILFIFQMDKFFQLYDLSEKIINESK